MFNITRQIKKYSDLPKNKLDLVGKKISVRVQGDYHGKTTLLELCFIASNVINAPEERSVKICFNNKMHPKTITFTVWITEDEITVGCYDGFKEDHDQPICSFISMSYK